MIEAVDVIVKTDAARDWLDATMLSFGALLSQQREPDGSYRVRCLGTTAEEAQQRADFISFAIKNQGYGEVVRLEPQEVPA